MQTCNGSNIAPAAEGFYDNAKLLLQEYSPFRQSATPWLAAIAGGQAPFLDQSRQYLFLGDYKYWIMGECDDLDPETYDGVLKRALLFKDRRDFIIRQGDTAQRGEMAPRATQELGNIQEVLIRDLVAGDQDVGRATDPPLDLDEPQPASAWHPHMRERNTEAASSGTIGFEETDDLEMTDVVLSGRTPLGGPRYVIIEASITVQESDVLTAKKRAAVLQKTSDIVTIPVVVGVLITEEARAATEEEDVLFIPDNPGEEFSPADVGADGPPV